MSNRISSLLVLIGVASLLYGSYLAYVRYTPGKLAFASYPSEFIVEYPVKQATPTQLRIPGIEVNLPVVPSTITSNRWETSNTGISYLALSPIPGEKGNSILYGHNWASILGKLPKINPGEIIQISFSDNTTKTFIVEYTHTVNPDEVEVIEQTEDIRITLYTCIGFLDSKRFVVVAKLQS
ncbi:hypothetical protein A3A55_02715 [Candidatus Roizmanbacteria bacterium RIFCSPLOWO2_01_FULL_40_14]|nr:MAG: hypothetical protein A3A55_02715 [Candidatus Roizmanbacteria bacterium RIFCSPLOWO2_01_FULL_40_14]